MTSPYINTELYTTVALYPNQMNNDIYINLKSNLEDKVLGMCFRDYGYINEIYEITKYDDGVIEAENLSSSAKYDISFSCRLCIPLRLTEIICKVDKVNKLLITVVNGPILGIITNERINDEVFFLDNNNSLRYKKENKSYLLKSGDFVRIVIESVQFNHGDEKIKVIGSLKNMAIDEEKKLFYQQSFNRTGELIEFAEYFESTVNPNDADQG